MRYLKYDSLEDALARDEQAWVDYMNRPVRPGDVTLYLWGQTERSGISYVLLNIDEGTEHLLTPQEQDALLDEDNPYVRAMLTPPPWPPVSDLNDTAPVITTDADQSIAENTIVVAALTSTDADLVGINPAIFTITGGPDATLFDIVGDNLVFRVAPDYETDPR